MSLGSLVALSATSIGLGALRIVLFAVGALIVATAVASAVKTVVVPRGISTALVRVVFVSLRRIFEAIAFRRDTFLARDAILAGFGPVAFLTLPVVWLSFTVAGFTAMQWAVSDTGAIRRSFYISGSSMLTLGVAFNTSLASAALSFVQALIGVLMTALLISYLPTLYGAFARRETLVGKLETRAGLPPSPIDALVRYRRIGALERLDADLFEPWEQWFVEVEESHTTFAGLVFFRSPRPERNWVTAGGCVLDTAAIYLSLVDLPFSPQAALCLRSGFLSFNRIAEYFAIPLPAKPLPTDPITVGRAEFDLMLDELRSVDIPLKADLDQAWRDFQGWRVNYDTALVALCGLVLAPPGRWSSDRGGDRLVPTGIRKTRAAKGRNP